MIRKFLSVLCAELLLFAPALAEPHHQHTKARNATARDVQRTAPKTDFTPLASDFGTGPAPDSHRRKLTLPTIIGFQNLIGSFPYVNGRGLFTGAMEQARDQYVSQLLGLALTCNSSSVCAPNVSGITAGGDLSGSLSAPTVAKITNPIPSIKILGTGGSFQPSIGQLGQITSPYTPAMLNTQNDLLRVIVGNFPLASQLEGSTSGTTVGAMFGLAIPAGTYSGVSTNPDAAASFYVINQSANAAGNTSGAPFKSGVGTYTLSMIGAKGSFVEGANISTVNSPAPFTVGSGNAGLDFFNMSGIEVDSNVYCTSAFTSGTSNCPSAGTPTGVVYGIISQLHGTAHSTGGENAFAAIGDFTQQWDTAFVSIAGAAAHGILLGPSTLGTSSVNSQDLRFQAIGASGPAPIDTFFADANGLMHVVAQSTDYSFGSGGFAAPSIVMKGPFYASPTAGLPNSNSQSIIMQAYNSSTTLQTSTLFEDSVGTTHILTSGLDFAFSSAGFSAAGLKTTGGLTAASLPTTGGTVKGTMCIDSTGLVYVKTTSGACL